VSANAVFTTLGAAIQRLEFPSRSETDAFEPGGHLLPAGFPSPLATIEKIAEK
jgi:hypothetical protein